MFLILVISLTYLFYCFLFFIIHQFYHIYNFQHNEYKLMTQVHNICFLNLNFSLFSFLYPKAIVYYEDFIFGIFIKFCLSLNYDFNNSLTRLFNQTENTIDILAVYLSKLCSIIDHSILINSINCKIPLF